jgi:hypothetical protein
MLGAILPHETTHCILAGQFGPFPVPRWVDEGVAVLTEPAAKIDLHRRQLARLSPMRDMFSISQLMEMPDYPGRDHIGAFYAQSVTLVEFLVQLRGPRVFTQFVRDGLRQGYQTALQRHYGYRDYNELQSRWVQFALQHGAAQSGAFAQR